MITGGEFWEGVLARNATVLPTNVLLCHRRRLAPEFTVPEIVNDAVNAYKWLSKEKNASDIILWGDSAGGALAMLLLQELIQDKVHHPVALPRGTQSPRELFTSAPLHRALQLAFVSW